MGLKIEKILEYVDHTLLNQTATKKDILAICDEGIKFKTASVCIPPCYVKDAKNYVGEKMQVCTVIGFPNGYNTIETKVFETKNAIENGADEIDMVINIGKLKAQDFDYVKKEIKEVQIATNGKILKVIIEACLLTDEEKLMMCDIVSELNVDFIKTSTGFSKYGATIEDVGLLKDNVGKNTSVKAAGGIKTIADAENFLNMGCKRLGTSSIVKIAKIMEE